MSIQFKDETFRGDYTFSNSQWAINRFPFPFHEDSFMYSVNMEQHRGGPDGSIYENRFDVDEHYVSEMRDRAMVLADDPLRCQSYLFLQESLLPLTIKSRRLKRKRRLRSNGEILLYGV